MAITTTVTSKAISNGGKATASASLTDGRVIRANKDGTTINFHIREKDGSTMEFGISTTDQTAFTNVITNAS